MPRGGKRANAGRKKGSKNRKIFTLESEVAAEKPQGRATPAERDRMLRRQVVMCVADGMTHEKIAAIMGFSLDKLEAVFRHELEHGREIVRAEELMRLDAQSAEGKTSATRTLLSNATTPKPTAPEVPEAPAQPKTQSRDLSPEEITKRALRLVTNRDG